ncbi:PLP-dependent aminotransferase family protein [Microbacterium sp. VKM Ac-2923]|uniref:MocR-like pyridoxine biosynthesis transcription factor PdxR n=1 Tax=Microbacterium sp. VKM Ac-2923 TaxID=2929476 RepID=UPI001FB282F1|nr:PLP-dependent aminotransferase family protein [Microbacterium sp. VKM Ac-2923]MCJ1707697.1 PLP-dependent aminotransferase family protein [Microbacterium sp. VKM Ac-2923]
MISLGILDRSSAAPLHEQLAHGLRAAVLAGRIGGGEVVPSTRALAADLGVARGTVVAAYEILAGEGYLLTRPGGRTVVAEVAHRSPLPPLPRGPASDRARVKRSVVDLRPGRPGTTGLADAAWRSAWRRATANDPDADVYDPAGTPALRAEIARHLGRARGLDVSAADVVVTAGTSDAMLLTLLALSPRNGRGSLRVAIEDPGYPRVRMILRRLGIEAVPVPVRPGSGLALDALEKLHGVDAVIVTPHHHYPLGSRLDAEDRARLLAWAAREDVVVIEDDYDSEFPHGRAPLPPLHLLDPARVVLIGSLSKTLTPAVRCGWIVATGDVGAAIRAARDDLDLPVSLVQQHALALYIAEGSLARHTARRRRDYRHRRRLLLEAFTGAAGVELTATDGGLHAVAVLPGVVPSGVAHPGAGVDGAGTDGERTSVERAIVADLDQRGVRVAPLGSYAVDADATSLPVGIAFGYAEPSTVALMEAVHAIIDVLRRHAARGASQDEVTHRAIPSR